MRRIALSGWIATGKDTAGQFLCDSLGCTRIGFADELKREAATLFDLNISVKTKHVRKVLQEYGTFCRSLDSHIWIRKLYQALKPETEYVVTDLRFRNEADFLRAIGFTIVRLMPGDMSLYYQRVNELYGYEKDGPELAHISEHDLDEYPFFDFTIISDTVGEMLSGLKQLV